jgi:hypothetical protein
VTQCPGIDHGAGNKHHHCSHKNHEVHYRSPATRVRARNSQKRHHQPRAREGGRSALGRWSVK